MFFSSLLVFMKKKNVRIKCFVWVYMWCRLDWTVMLKPNCFYIVASLTTFRYDQVVLALVVLLVADKSESLFFAHQCSWAQFFLVRFLGFSSKIFNCGVETISSFFSYSCVGVGMFVRRSVCVFFSFHFEKQVVIMLNIESLFALDYICCFDLWIWISVGRRGWARPREHLPEKCK